MLLVPLCKSRHSCSCKTTLCIYIIYICVIYLYPYLFIYLYIHTYIYTYISDDNLHKCNSLVNVNIVYNQMLSQYFLHIRYYDGHLSSRTTMGATEIHKKLYKIGLRQSTGHPFYHAEIGMIMWKVGSSDVGTLFWSLLPIAGPRGHMRRIIINAKNKSFLSCNW